MLQSMGLKGNLRDSGQYNLTGKFSISKYILQNIAQNVHTHFNYKRENCSCYSENSQKGNKFLQSFHA